MAGQRRHKSFSDADINEMLARIDGVHYGPQRIESASFHPFPARMPLTIAEFIIERLSMSSATILDPMVGSGFPRL